MKKLLIIAFCIPIYFQSQSQGIYLKTSDTNLQGESTDPGFTDQIECSSLNYGVSNTFDLGGGGTGTGKPKFTDVSFIHEGSKNSPWFNLYTANGKVISSAEFSIVRLIAGKSTVVYSIKLNDVHVTSVVTAATGECTSCAFGTETITFEFSKITMKDLISGTTITWDLAANKSL